jgi:hypothetical protein
MVIVLAAQKALNARGVTQVINWEPIYNWCTIYFTLIKFFVFGISQG